MGLQDFGQSIVAIEKEWERPTIPSSGELLNTLNDDGSLNDKCPQEYVGMDRFDARKKIVNGQ